jgi:hypothetical protein
MVAAYLIPKIRRQRQENLEFEARVNYIARTCLEKKRGVEGKGEGRRREGGGRKREGKGGGGIHAPSTGLF